MIHDRLVGIRDIFLSERLQLCRFNSQKKQQKKKSREAIGQKEAVGEQQHTLQAAERNNPIVLDTTNMKQRFYNKK